MNILAEIVDMPAALFIRGSRNEERKRIGTHDFGIRNAVHIPVTYSVVKQAVA